MYQKQTTYRNDDYLSWIRTQQCSICKSGPCQAAHQSILDPAAGRKASDKFAIPLCYRCHMDGEHQKGILTTWNSRSGHTFKDKYYLKDYLRGLCERYFERYQKCAAT